MIKLPKSHYLTVWNVESVLNFIENSWCSSEKSSDKQMTYKETILILWTSASSASAIQPLDITFILRTP